MPSPCGLPEYSTNVGKFNYDKRIERLRQVRKGEALESVESGRTALPTVTDTLCAGTPSIPSCTEQVQEPLLPERRRVTLCL